MQHSEQNEEGETISNLDNDAILNDSSRENDAILNGSSRENDAILNNFSSLLRSTLRKGR